MVVLSEFKQVYHAGHPVAKLMEVLQVEATNHYNTITHRSPSRPAGLFGCR